MYKEGGLYLLSLLEDFWLISCSNPNVNWGAQKASNAIVMGYRLWHTKKLSKTCEASISRLTRKGEEGVDSLVGAIPGLSLCNNSLDGAILDDLGNCTELTYLDISINLLTGSIPRIDGDGDLDL
ncbi:hypothetical protein Pint_03727 [Pistacia integerrima]|uniref:Uncharacterized protein n=1 Tax=Pistacia integerrima TaxID=434235 RepID=A0ACC0Z0I0_9ROSI|nr:hypothetical protein Pint_03727 [Pistacia integerrima]